MLSQGLFTTWMIGALTACCIHGQTLSALDNKGSLRGTDRALSTNQEPVLCRIYELDTLYNGDELESEGGGDNVACAPIIDGIESDDLLPVNLPQEIFEKHGDEIPSAKVLIWITKASVGQGELIVSDESEFIAVDHSERSRYLADDSSSHWTTGSRTIAIVRISTTDSTPDDSLSDLRQGMFEKPICLKTQYQACSFGQLDWQFASAHEVVVSNRVSAYASPTDLVTAAQQQLRADLGIAQVTELADKVVMCLPPGTFIPSPSGPQPWAAKAGVGHWRAEFNNDWCLSLTALMHEIGHTIGLNHSNEKGQAYGDSTGYMAAGHTNADWPRKCFNGHKNSILGWYDDRTLAVNPVAGTSHVKLATFVDYDRTNPSEPVLINVADRYFLQYNRAKGMNVDTEEKKNLVTVTVPVEGGPSDGVAGLGVGDRYVVPSYHAGKPLWIEVCESRPGSPDVMVVSIGLEQSNCGQPLPDDRTPSPTRAPTKAPVSKEEVLEAEEANQDDRTPVPTKGGHAYVPLTEEELLRLMNQQQRAYPLGATAAEKKDNISERKSRVGELETTSGLARV